jgi:hypothetical protein
MGMAKTIWLCSDMIGTSFALLDQWYGTERPCENWFKDEPVQNTASKQSEKLGIQLASVLSTFSHPYYI